VAILLHYLLVVIAIYEALRERYGLRIQAMERILRRSISPQIPNTPKQDPPKQDPPKQDPPKQDPPKQDAPDNDVYITNFGSRVADRITTASFPRWTWRNADCKVWLYRMLTETCGLPRAEAYTIATGFEGFGVNLYTDDFYTWQTIMPGKLAYTFQVTMQCLAKVQLPYAYAPGGIPLRDSPPNGHPERPWVSSTVQN
jgi:hypothetical protein